MEIKAAQYQLTATNRRVTISEPEGTQVTVLYPHTPLEAKDKFEVFLDCAGIDLTISGQGDFQSPDGRVIFELSMSEGSSPSSFLTRECAEHPGFYEPYFDDAYSPPLSSLSFARSARANPGPLVLTDPNGVLVLTPIDVRVANGELHLSPPAIIQPGATSFSELIIIHPLSSIELEAAALVSNGQHQPLPPIRVKAVKSRHQKRNKVAAPTVELLLEEFAQCGVSRRVEKLTLGKEAEGLLSSGSSAGLVAGAASNGSRALVEAGSGSASVDVGSVKDAELHFLSLPKSTYGIAEPKAHCRVSASLENVSVTVAAVGKGAKILEFGDHAHASNIQFSGHHSVKVRANRAVVLADVTGSFEPERLNNATIRGASAGFRLDFSNSAAIGEGELPILSGAELSRVVVPGVSEPDSIRSLKELESARAITPHRDSWEKFGGNAFERLRDSIRAIRVPNDEQRLMAHLIDVAALTHEKARDAASRCATQIAANDARQLSAESRTERLLLFFGRLVGYGLRIGRPALLLALLSLVGVLWANLSAGSTSLGISNSLSFLSDWFRYVVSPIALLPGVSAADTNKPLGEVPLLARAVFTVPFSAILLAVKNRARWRPSSG